MDDKKLFKIGLAAAIMVVLACLVSMPAKEQADVVAGTPLVQGLDTKSITAIEVSGVGKTARLVKNESGFVVESKNNYPAVYAEVNKLLVNCLDIKISEFVTANPDNYIDLQVADSNADRSIKFFGQDGKLITGVIIGKRDQQSGRTYVRTISADEKAVSRVYLADRVAWIYTNPVSYVEKGLLKCEKADITSVSVTTSEGAYTLLAKTDESGTVSPVLDNIPEGKEVKEADLKQVFEAATDISFDDLQLASETDSTLKFDTRYVVTTSDKTVLTLEVAKGNIEGAEKYFIKCSSRYDNKEFMDKVASGNFTVGKDKESMEAADSQLQVYQAVQDFNARHKGWVYIMESYKGAKLSKNLSDLVQDIAKPEAQTADEAESVDDLAAPSAN